MMKRFRAVVPAVPIALASLAAMMSLAACSSQQPAPSPEAADDENVYSPPPPVERTAPEPAPPIEEPKKAEPMNVAQDEPVDQSAQMQEDADATGMTSRLPEASADASGDSEQPTNSSGR